MSVQRTRFHGLVDERYVARGMTRSAAIATIFLRSGVGQKVLWNAYRGFRVSEESAARIREWAYAEHGIEDLDVDALVSAPRQDKRRVGSP